MYLEHFGLQEAPFRITPHTDFFFDGADRGATLEGLLYAIQHDEGIVKVSGEVGSGKTMLCRVLMERLPEHVDTIYLANPALSRDDILYAIADDLEVEYARDRLTIVMRQLHDRLIDLYAQGRRVVILIDEAHAMPQDTLEQVRLLSNLESSRHKLLQIVLFGQPELDDMLAAPSLRQLRDRVTHSFRMRPLTEREVGRYLMFRMRAAGYRGPDVFTPKAIGLIARASAGLTRRINILTDKALLSAYSTDAHQVDARQARAAIADADLSPLAKSRRPALYVLAALGLGVLLGAGLQWMLGLDGGGASPSWRGHVVTTPASRPMLAPPADAGAGTLPAPAAGAAGALPAGPAGPEGSPSGKAAVTDATSAPTQMRRSDAATAGDDATGEGQAPGTRSPAHPAAAVVGLTDDQRRRFGGYSGARQQMLRERLAATRQVFEHVPDDRFTIELFVTENSDPARTERFLQRAEKLVKISDIYIVPIAGPGSYRLWVVYGIYTSREAAEEAAQALPDKYREAFELHPRAIEEIRRSV